MIEIAAISTRIVILSACVPVGTDLTAQCGGVSFHSSGGAYHKGVSNCPSRNGGPASRRALPNPLVMLVPDRER